MDEADELHGLSRLRAKGILTDAASLKRLSDLEHKLGVAPGSSKPSATPAPMASTPRVVKSTDKKPVNDGEAEATRSNASSRVLSATMSEPAPLKVPKKSYTTRAASPFSHSEQMEMAKRLNMEFSKGRSAHSIHRAAIGSARKAVVDVQAGPSRPLAARIQFPQARVDSSATAKTSATVSNPPKGPNHHGAVATKSTPSAPHNTSGNLLPPHTSISASKARPQAPAVLVNTSQKAASDAGKDKQNNVQQASPSKATAPDSRRKNAGEAKTELVSQEMFASIMKSTMLVERSIAAAHSVATTAAELSTRTPGQNGAVSTTKNSPAKVLVNTIDSPAKQQSPALTVPDKSVEAHVRSSTGSGPATVGVLSVSTGPVSPARETAAAVPISAVAEGKKSPTSPVSSTERHQRELALLQQLGTLEKTVVNLQKRLTECEERLELDQNVGGPDIHAPFLVTVRYPDGSVEKIQTCASMRINRFLERALAKKDMVLDAQRVSLKYEGKELGHLSFVGAQDIKEHSMMHITTKPA